MDDSTFYCAERSRRIEEMNNGLIARPALEVWARNRVMWEAKNKDLRDGDEQERVVIRKASGAAQSDKE